MTNAEKLAENTELLARLFQEAPVGFCDICPAQKYCNERRDGCYRPAKEWLESEVEENAEVH